MISRRLDCFNPHLTAPLVTELVVLVPDLVGGRLHVALGLLLHPLHLLLRHQAPHHPDVVPLIICRLHPEWKKSEEGVVEMEMFAFGCDVFLGWPQCPVTLDNFYVNIKCLLIT